MLKSEYDKIFVKLLPLIEDVTKRLISKYHKYYLETGNVISYAYEHNLRFLDQLETTNQVQQYTLKFIRSNINWERSDLTKAEIIKDSTLDGYDVTNEDDEAEYINKINIENWYSTKKSILVEYRRYESDKVFQIIYDCYFIKHITVGVLLAKHLGVNKDIGCWYIRQMKQRIRDFEINQYNKLI